MKSSNGYFRVPAPQALPRLRLYCFPFAGGSTITYERWYEDLPEGVELVSIQLPGRGIRFSAEPIRRLDTLLDELVPVMATNSPTPFAFFGHSMGALIVYELTRRLAREGRRTPRVLFVSGKGAPHLPNEEAPRHRLPDDQFIQHIVDLGGTPQEVLDEPELLEMFIPVLRADYELVETYHYEPEPPLQVPIIALGGAHDEWTPYGELLGWSQHTTERFDCHVFPGDHFYIHNETKNLLAVISRHLESLSPR